MLERVYMSRHLHSHVCFIQELSSKLTSEMLKVSSMRLTAITPIQKPYNGEHAATHKLIFCSFLRMKLLT